LSTIVFSALYELIVHCKFLSLISILCPVRNMTETNEQQQQQQQEHCDPFSNCDFDFCGKGRKDVDDSIAPVDSNSRYGTSADEADLKVQTVVTNEPESTDDLEEATSTVASVSVAGKSYQEDETVESAAKNTDAYSQSQDTYDEQEEPMKEGKSNLRRNRIIIVICLIVFIAIVIVGAALAPRGAKKDTTASLSEISDGKNDASDGPTVPPVEVLSPEGKVDQLIRLEAIFGGEEFNDKDSYQKKALDWVISDSIVQRRSLADTPSNVRWTDEQIVQRYALASFYYSTYSVPHNYTEEFFGGDVKPWVNNSNWMERDSECEWFGIDCDDDGHVTGINMHDNHLSGSLPREITLMKLLELLDVPNNGLYNSGEDGNDWLGDMAEMKYLSFAENYFDYYGIPTTFSKLTNLRELDCSYTLYYGPLKEEVFQGLDELEYVVLSGNQYDGPLPTSLLTLPALENLYASHTSVTGSLDFLTDLKGKIAPLTEFWLDENSIEGSIPVAIGSMEGLLSFSAAYNQLSGPIPTELGQLTDMKQIWLYNNDLTGTVPTELSSLTKLEMFLAMNNTLTGSVPDGMCGIESLEDDWFVVDCGLDVTCDCCRGNCSF